MSPSTTWKALNRFGLGARPDEAAGIDDARAWLHAQLRQRDAADPAFAALPSSADYLRRESAYLAERRARKVDKDVAGKPAGTDKPAQGDGFRASFGRDTMAELDARYRVALNTPHGFTERLVQFWSNHFAVSADKRPAALYAAPMEREAIRPHVFGHFADLLIAVESHPAMLRYLDNAQSIGDDSRLATRIARRTERTRGLNENLAREILELHTLGVDGGYTQTDVTELARAITGWSTPGPRDRDAIPASGFVFRANAHAGGVRTVLGTTYPDAGVEQGRDILRNLARNDATARHIAWKLARHFVADVPAPALVDRIAAAWRTSDGQLVAVYSALIDAPEAWSPDARKFKTPNDFLVSALRALDAREPPAGRMLFGMLDRLGQPPFVPRSPAGFPDTAADWSGADALWKRVQLADTLAQQRAPANATSAVLLGRARAVLGPRLDDETATALQRSESPQQAVALLLACPAFQWRA